jgi:hypothetical protein
LRLLTIKEQITELTQTVDRIELADVLIESLDLETLIAKSAVEIIRVSDGLYRIGDKTVSIRINPEQNKQLQVRVGTTWIALDDYMSGLTVDLKADFDQETPEKSKGKKKKKAKKQAAELDLDIDSDDATLLTRFAQVQKSESEVAKEEFSDKQLLTVERKNAVRKPEKKNSARLTAIQEEEDNESPNKNSQELTGSTSEILADFVVENVDN